MPIKKLKVRGFEVAKGFEDVRLPERSTEHSAGYDFFAYEDCEILKGEIGVIATGVKAYMKQDEYLLLANRSSNPKKGLELANGIGICDKDFYSNETDDGHVRFLFRATKSVVIKKGDKIGQGIFMPYLVADSGNTNNTRKGGWGSTGA